MAAAHPSVRPCPQCGRELPRDARRCGFCLAELRSLDASTRFAPAFEPPAAQRRRRFPWLGRRALTLVLLASIALAMLGRCAHARYIARPDPLPLPATRAIALAPAGAHWPAPDGGAGAARSTTAAPVLRTSSWQQPLGAAVQVPPVADERHLYVGLVDDRLVALRVTDGSAAWTYQAPHRLWSAPVIAGDRLYLSLRRGEIVALDAASGEVRWTTPVPGSLFASPTIVDGLLVAAAAEGLFGLEPASGRLLWHARHDLADVTLAPIVLERHIVVATLDDVRVFSRETGRQTYAFAQIRPRGLAAEGNDIFSAASRFVAAIDPRSRVPWWERWRTVWSQFWIYGLAPKPPAPDSTWVQPLSGAALRTVYPPALGPQHLVVADADGIVRAFDRRTGAPRWQLEAGPLAGAPTLTPAGLLLVGRDALSLRALEDGREVDRLALPRTLARDAVVTTHGTYVVDHGGTAYGLR